MNPLETAVLDDVQAQVDHRNVDIEAVGIADLRYPVTLTGRDGTAQRTVATIAMDVDLPGHVRGTHMSRFVEVLHDSADGLSPRGLPDVAAELRARLGSERARVVLDFPYFLERTAPVSGMRSLIDIEGRIAVSSGRETTTLEIAARVPVTSLCPCSKEISDYGAHNQRGHVELHVHCSPSDPVWLEDLVEAAEQAASAPIYPLLKRVDERHVTMQAYDNPAFVEDIVRDAAVALREDDRVLSFTASAANQESIHNHSAVARVRWERAA